MKNFLAAYIFTIIFCFSISAQKIEKPILTLSKPTAAQQDLINQGIKLHDARRYDEAIELYARVLKDCPDCSTAIYETAFSYYRKGDLDKSLEMALKASTYKSSSLPLIYLLIGSIVDDQGDPKRAVEIYKQAIKLEPDSAPLYYNIAVTLSRLKQGREAKENLKKAVELDFGYASPQSLLAENFYQARYKIPALLAASRLISLELNTERTTRAIEIFKEVLSGGTQKSDKPNTINILVDTDAPTDEGDFSAFTLLVGLASVGTDMSEENENKSMEEKFVGKVENLVSFLETEKKTKSTFAGKNYFPFMLEMKRKGYVQAFAYLVLQQSGNQKAEQWLSENKQTGIAFLNWAKSYKP